MARGSDWLFVHAMGMEEGGWRRGYGLGGMKEYGGGEVGGKSGKKYGIIRIERVEHKTIIGPNFMNKYGIE